MKKEQKRKVRPPGRAGPSRKGKSDLGKNTGNARKIHNAFSGMLKKFSEPVKEKL